MGQCDFFTTSVDSNHDPEVFRQMIADAKRISYAAFIRYVPEDELAEVFPHYDWAQTGGVEMKNDPDLHFYKSKYSGNFAVFVENDAMEFVWICGMRHPRTLEDQEIDDIRARAGLPPLTEAGFGPERGPLEFEKITDFDLDDNELQERLLFWILAGGMSSTMAAKGLHGLMQTSRGYELGPFEGIKQMGSPEAVAKALQEAGYSFFNQRAKYIWAAAHEQIDLRHGTMGDILCFKGVGLKSASCFLLHSRENIEMAGLDTHILKWLKAKGVEGVPKATPSNKKTYDRLEQEFLRMAKERGMSPTDLDLAIWNAQRQGEVYP